MISVDYLKYDVSTKSTILVTESETLIPGKPETILERWANPFGLGLSGSQSAFKSTLAIRQKIPVLIDPFRQIYFFPTQSPQSPQCIWINASRIKAIRQSGLNASVQFVGGNSVCLPIGRRSLMKQWKRCQMMELHILRHRLSCPE